MRALLIALLLVAGCGSDDHAAADMSAVADLATPYDLSLPADLVVLSSCGQPGDRGNSLGVGKYCVQQSDCTPGTICTHSFVADQYFCTIGCSASNPDVCGENAVCACQGNQCGCVPASCAMPVDRG